MPITTMNLAMTLVSLWAFAGCNSKNPNAPTATAPDQALDFGEPAPNPTGDVEYLGPYAAAGLTPMRLLLLQRESFPVQYVADVQITVPTGGWKLTLDEGTVENGVAKVKLTLEKPGEDEMVTQALVDLRQSFVTTEPFTRAEVYIWNPTRGNQYLTVNYDLAAKK